MFDISFAEMLVISVVALVVLGPERLPGVARTLGHLFGRAQRYMNDVKNDIQREIEFEELKKLRSSVEDTARSIEETAQTGINQLREGMAAVETSESDNTIPSGSAETAPAVGPPTDTSSPGSVIPANPDTTSGRSESDLQRTGTDIAAGN